MQRSILGGLFLLGMTAGPSWAAELPAAPMPKVPWYKRWFGATPQPVVPSRPVRRDPAAEAARIRASAENDLLRRLAVCTELRQANPALDDQVLRLEEQAWEIYRRQTADLPCNRLVPQDEKALTGHLLGNTTLTTAAARLEPTITDPTGKAQAAVIREVKP